jgi:folate-binding protein YgfZ
MLNNQGKYLFDFFVYTPSPEEIVIDINYNNKKSLIEHFNFYKLRTKIEITDLSDQYHVTYAYDKTNKNSLVTVRDPRYNLLGFRSIITKEPGNKSTAKKLYLEDKYNFSIIDGYHDLISNKSIPILYGAEELKAISYDKGCYVGQEIISRAKYQGTVRKKIFKILSDKDLSNVKKEEDIFADEDKIGLVCSVYKNKGIALIKEEQYLSKQRPKFTVSGCNISLSLPPWYD